VSDRVRTVLKALAYPAFYLLCLFAFVVLAFPWDALRDRIVADFARTQASKGADAWRLEIASVDGYWLSGVELRGVKLVIPPSADDDGPAASPKNAALARLTKKSSAAKKGDAEGEAATDSSTTDDPSKDDKAKKAKGARESVVLVEEAHARVRLLPLLIGRVRVDFAASVFGGEVKGTIPVGSGDLEIELAGVDLSQIAPLEQTVSVPLKGVASGTLTLSSQGAKWSKATGALDLTVSDMVLGDGKAKFRNLIALPPASLGTFTIQAKADAGVLKIEKFGASGRDVEVAGEGTVKLKEPWDASATDLWLRFGFSDEYKNKDDRTKALFLDDGPFPALISQDRKLKKAKRPDGLWGFHVQGRLGRLRYDPTTADGPKPKSGTQQTEGGGKKKPSKKADDDDDDDKPSSAAPATKAARPERTEPDAEKAERAERAEKAERAEPEPAPVFVPPPTPEEPAREAPPSEPAPAPAPAPAPDDVAPPSP
jgi:type II secretion system protein N